MTSESALTYETRSQEVTQKVTGQRLLGKKRFLIPFCIVSAVIVALLTLDISKYSPYAETALENFASENDVGLQLNDFRLKLNGADADSAQITIPKLFLYFELRDLALRTSLSSFLFAKPFSTITGTGYGGTVSADNSHSITEGTGKINLSIDGFELAQFPQLMLLGLQSGSLDVSLKNGAYTPSGISSGDITAVVKKFEKPQKTSIDMSQLAFLGLPSIPGKFQIPAVNNGKLLAKLSIHNELLTSEKILLSSSLGKVTSTLKMGLKSGSETIDFRANFSLTERGSEDLGYYIPMLSNGKLSEKDRHLKLSVIGPLGAPRVYWSRDS